MDVVVVGLGRGDGSGTYTMASSPAFLLQRSIPLEGSEVGGREARDERGSLCSAHVFMCGRMHIDRKREK